MKMRMTNLLYVRLQEKNRSKKDVLKPLMTKTLHLWFLRDLRALSGHTATEEKGTTNKARSNCCTGTTGVKGLARASRGDLSILRKKTEGEALRNIINKLSDECNLRDIHLKHNHMSTAQFKKRTTHLNIPGNFSDLHQHVVKTCPFCNSTKPRPERSRVSGLRAEEFGDLIFLDHESAKIEDKTFGFLIVLDGAASHLTAYPCKSTSPSEAIKKLHDWMDTFQMNPKVICADVAFHHPHDMQAFYRMHNVKKF